MVMSYADVLQRLDDVRFTVMAASSRLWRPGDTVRPGQHLGDTMDGVPVHAALHGRVAGIQYDIETDEVILIVQAIANAA